MTPLQNGTLLALGTVAAVAVAGVVHQRGMRGSGSKVPAIPPSLAHVIPADARYEGQVGPGRSAVWSSGDWRYAVDLDVSPPRLVNSGRDLRNATQADVWAAADAEVGPRFDLDRERGSRSMPLVRRTLKGLPWNVAIRTRGGQHYISGPFGWERQYPGPEPANGRLAPSFTDEQMEPLGPFTILNPGGERNAAAARAEVLADQKRLGSRNEGSASMVKWKVGDKGVSKGGTPFTVLFTAGVNAAGNTDLYVLYFPNNARVQSYEGWTDSGVVHE